MGQSDVACAPFTLTNRLRAPRMHSRPSIAVFLDSPDENWVAMNFVGEMLLRQWKTSLAADVAPSAFSIDLPHLARRMPQLTRARAFQIDCAAGRFIAYPPVAARERGKHDFFHVVDHSYAQLVHVLPHDRTGVYCHDLDAFRSVLDPAKLQRPAWFRAMQGIALLGLCSARLVFYSTQVVRDQIERSKLVPASRLVHAPYGIAPEFHAEPTENEEADSVLRPLGGRPFLLHVSSSVPRKRLDVLFETFARLLARFPDLFLVKGGAGLSDAQWAHVDRLGIRDRVVLTGKISRAALCAIYQRSKAVLVTSEAEGFGLPVIEALACGTPVFASDIPVLHEVGRDAIAYCRVGDPDQWAALVGRFLSGEAPAPPLSMRLARAANYSWRNHAQSILDAYRSLD
jgi:glycosyltransferase involved in cell wall biosynthesis